MTVLGPGDASFLDDCWVALFEVGACVDETAGIDGATKEQGCRHLAEVWPN